MSSIPSLAGLKKELSNQRRNFVVVGRNLGLFGCQYLRGLILVGILSHGPGFLDLNADAVTQS